jgi:hypothetical protein
VAFKKGETYLHFSGVPRIFFFVRGHTRNFFGGGGSTNSVEDRGKREWGAEDDSPLDRVPLN